MALTNVTKAWIDEWVDSLQWGKVVIYALCEPKNHEKVRYIGSTWARPGESIETALDRRLTRHISEAKAKRSRSARQMWLRKLSKSRSKPVIRLVDYTNEYENTQARRDYLEWFYIAWYEKAGFDLLNGGGGEWYRHWMELFEKPRLNLGPWSRQRL